MHFFSFFEYIPSFSKKFQIPALNRITQNTASVVVIILVGMEVEDKDVFNYDDEVFSALNSQISYFFQGLHITKIYILI